MDNYLPKPKQPKFWKALVVTAILVIPAAILSYGFVRTIHMPDVVWLALSLFIWLAVATTVHLRVSNDWRAQYTMNLTEFEARHAVPRNVRVDRR